MRGERELLVPRGFGADKVVTDKLLHSAGSLAFDGELAEVGSCHIAAEGTVKPASDCRISDLSLIVSKHQL